VASVSALDGMSFGGAAGLYVVPTGRIGWEREADLGMDLGLSYDFINKNPIAKMGFSLFKWVEISGAFDLQNDRKDRGDNFDYLLGLKIQLPTQKTAIAIGGNYQLLHHSNSPRNQDDEVPLTMAGQVYVAATYPGQVFSMPAETTVALGYTFVDPLNSNVDYGMGFDLTLLPDIFQKYLHWMIDFSNFSYSVDPVGINAAHRGSLNTGFRIDIGAAPALNRFKFMVDFIATDILDDGSRSFVAGLTLGGIIK
jgi:hypothetical protein